MNLLQPSIDVQKLTAIVFELSSQLHQERLHRLALEAALVRAGLLEVGATTKLASDPAVREASRQAANKSVDGLIRVLTEHDDERAPLRPNDFPA